MAETSNDSAARYGHGPEIAARLTAWVETSREVLRDIEAAKDGVAA